MRSRRWLNWIGVAIESRILASLIPQRFIKETLRLGGLLTRTVVRLVSLGSMLIGRTCLGSRLPEHADSERFAHLLAILLGSILRTNSTSQSILSSPRQPFLYIKIRRYIGKQTNSTHKDGLILKCPILYRLEQENTAGK
jgi:hypothetical protein